MGCSGSKRTRGDEAAKKIRRPKPWKHSEPITRTQLMQMRDEFWDTAPHYGGQKGPRTPCRNESWSDNLRV
ncbi:DC-UbP/UBTD2 [Theobroma cacao]|nr:DC-UbP/UBTD2 [Theobroma cacao]